jgi:hypothetical protein
LMTISRFSIQKPQQDITQGDHRPVPPLHGSGK